jgi:hypothetical protein
LLLLNMQSQIFQLQRQGVSNVPLTVHFK